MYLRYQVIPSISKIYETHHDRSMREMMESPLTESTEIGLEDVEQFSPGREIVMCLTNTSDCGKTRAQLRCISEFSLGFLDALVQSRCKNPGAEPLPKLALVMLSEGFSLN